MKPLPGISAVLPQYDALILDLWGVVHDGTHLYDGVHDTLVRLREAGKKIVFLSNAPRRAAKVEKTLNSLGVSPDLYDHVFSSGEMGYQWLNSGKHHLGKRYYYIGPAKDIDVLDGLDCVRVDDIKDADFILNVGFGSEEQSTDDWMPLLRSCRAQGLPMLCLNPDLEVVKITGERFPCAGVIARAYQNIGGLVTWFGKPFPAVYDQCMQWLSPLDKQRVLAVGDSLDTDIPGAVRYEMDCALVTGGILKKEKPEIIDAMVKKMGLIPNYVMPKFSF
jgi:HAD superfamily hydrolase (TIGR01459 family)